MGVGGLTRLERAATNSDVYRRATSVHQAYKTRVERASNVSPTCSWRFLNFTFLSTRPALVWIIR